MKYLNELPSWIIGAFGALYSFITGNFDVATWCLVIIMGLDIISGVLKGAQANNLRSSISSLGIAKKGGILLTIIFGFVLDMAINNGQAVFSTMFTWVAIGNESLSFIENVASLGVPIPQGIIDKLGQLRDEYTSITADKDNQLTLSNKTELRDANTFDSDYSVKDFAETVDEEDLPDNTLDANKEAHIDDTSGLEGKQGKDAEED